MSAHTLLSRDEFRNAVARASATKGIPGDFDSRTLSLLYTQYLRASSTRNDGAAITVTKARTRETIAGRPCDVHGLNIFFR